MDYQRIYDELIAFRQANIPTGYVERHHIVMSTLGGTDDHLNLVKLTGREHWIAHLLLHKIYRLPETVHACNMMAMRCEERGIPFIKSSRMYETIRKECAKLTSARMKISQAGEGNSQHGTRWICNVDLKENKKILKTAEIPEGWIVGRNKWNIQNRLDERATLYQTNLENKQTSVSESKRMQLELEIDLILKFSHGNYRSLNSFSKEIDFSQRTLSTIFRKHGFTHDSKTKAFSSADAKTLCACSPMAEAYVLETY